MSEIEKMKRYIERTDMKIDGSSPYQLNIREALELADQARSSSVTPIGIISLAFSYGMAKGYRAAKAEVRHGQTV